MKHLLYISTLLIGISSFAQSVPSKADILNHFGIKESTVDGILYYICSNTETPKTKLVVYLQGSHPSPQFSYSIKNETTQYQCFIKNDFKSLPEDYLYVVIEKTGFEGVFDETNIDIPKEYVQVNSLDNRVERANTVIDFLTSKYNLDKVIVYGHSEGAPVAAKLATVNEKITHLGFWAGNALPDFFDFILENRIRFHKGEISSLESQETIAEIIDGFVNEIAKDTLNTTGEHYTKKRWWSYAEPPLNHLLKLDIPIYVQVASEDKNAPIESTYLIPLEFARLKKHNLTYEVCQGCNHGFSVNNEDGSQKYHWNKIFGAFIKWTEK